MKTALGKKEHFSENEWPIARYFVSSHSLYLLLSFLAFCCISKDFQGDTGRGVVRGASLLVADLKSDVRGVGFS